MKKWDYYFMNGKGFNLLNVEVHKKGYLKGYVTGILETEYSNDFTHEFLYRITDKENGENFTLVSVDYGYKIPLTDIDIRKIEWNIYNDYIRNKIITENDKLVLDYL